VPAATSADDVSPVRLRLPGPCPLPLLGQRRGTRPIDDVVEVLLVDDVLGTHLSRPQLPVTSTRSVPESGREVRCAKQGSAGPGPRESESHSPARSGQVVIPRDEDQPRSLKGEGRGEMNGVVPSKGMLLGEVSRRKHHIVRHLHPVEIPEPIVKGSPRIGKALPGQSSRSACCRKGGAGFRVRQVAGGDEVGGVPQLVGPFRSILGHEELHDRRRLEVRGHRRCSATSSETGLLLLTRR